VRQHRARHAEIKQAAKQRMVVAGQAHEHRRALRVRGALVRGGIVQVERGVLEVEDGEVVAGLQRDLGAGRVAHEHEGAERGFSRAPERLEGRGGRCLHGWRFAVARRRRSVAPHVLVCTAQDITDVISRSDS